MRGAILAAPLAVLLAGPLAGRALAQVSVDMRALDQPAPAPASPPPPGAPPAKAHPPRHAEARVAAKPAPPATTPPPLPTAVPPEVRLSPIDQPPPAAHPAPPPPPPVTAEAGGDATAIPNGLRVTFSASRADMTPATADALRAFAAQVASGAAPVEVRAYAAPVPDDASTPRRLALSRSLAIRDALIAAGLPSTRVYLRALGAADTGQGPPDRADVTVETANP